MLRHHTVECGDSLQPTDKCILRMESMVWAISTNGLNVQMDFGVDVLILAELGPPRSTIVLRVMECTHVPGTLFEIL